MNYKELVQSVYPNAIYVDGEVVNHIITSGFGYHVPGSTILNHSEKDSWRGAWSVIEYQMIKKLEL